MKNPLKNFSFPYKAPVLIISAVLIFTPVFVSGAIISSNPQKMNPVWITRSIFLICTFLAAVGFIYCTLGYHFQILRGDELKLRIHLEAINVSFTTMLVFLFLLIFIFLNFWPTMLNWLLVILAIIGIVTYLLAVEFIKEKYQ